MQTRWPLRQRHSMPHLAPLGSAEQGTDELSVLDYFPPALARDQLSCGERAWRVLDALEDLCPPISELATMKSSDW